MKISRFLFKYCLQLPDEESAAVGGGEAMDEKRYNEFIRAIRLINICVIREIKKDKDFVKEIMEYIKVNSPEYRMLYLELISIIQDFDNKSSNEGLRRFIKELLYFENDDLNKSMYDIITRANAIHQDDKVICYKSDNIQNYLNSIK